MSLSMIALLVFMYSIFIMPFTKSAQKRTDEEAFLKEITQIKTEENKRDNKTIKERLKEIQELLKEDLIT